MPKALPLNPQTVKKGDKVFLIPFQNHGLNKALYPLFLVDDFMGERGLKQLNYQDYRKIIFEVEEVLLCGKEYFLIFKEFSFDSEKGVRQLFRAQFFSILK